MDKTSVIIIGGGIGGLTAAIALQKINVPVKVFERAPELKEVGAGIGLWLNAVQAFDKLGIGEKIRSFSSPLKLGEITTPKGKVLSRIDIEKILNSKEAVNFIMHRADLHSSLKEALPPECFETSAVLRKNRAGQRRSDRAFHKWCSGSRITANRRRRAAFGSQKISLG